MSVRTSPNDRSWGKTGSDQPTANMTRLTRFGSAVCIVTLLVDLRSSIGRIEVSR
jgi:hypothetical protein